MCVTQLFPLYTFYLDILMTIHSVFLLQTFLTDCLTKCLHLDVLEILHLRKTQIKFLTPSCPLPLPTSSSMFIPKLLSRHPSQRSENLSWVIFPSVSTSNKTLNSVDFASRVSLTLFPSLYPTVITLVQVSTWFPCFQAYLLYPSSTLFPEAASLQANYIAPFGL